ncbi:MAG: hypothetical protein ACE5IJ_12055 [Thermoplasmata archaeon]
MTPEEQRRWLTILTIAGASITLIGAGITAASIVLRTITPEGAS